MMVLANTYRTIGYVIAALLIVAFLIYLFLNYRQARPETGAELELASNRKPYMDDAELETKKLDATLGIGLVTLAVVAVALPMYWLAEPGRQEGAEETFANTFEHRGEDIYVEFCSGCHAAGGVGGVTSQTLTTADGDFIAAVEWNVPALNTVLYRYSREEVEFILNYGRGNTPMPAWGLPGGGSLTEQQVANVIDYLEAIQLPVDEVRTEVRQGIIDAYVDRVLEAAEDEQGELDEDTVATLTAEATEEIEGRVDENVFDMDLDGQWTSKELGEALFNLEANSGTYSCARCHTKGWSYGEPEASGGGFFGPNLTNGATLRQFPTFQEHVAFITEGAEMGQAYGSGGLSGNGQMPSFGYNPNAEEEGSTLVAEQFMLTIEQIEAIVEYERSL